METPSLGFSALWMVNADVDPDLVYAITKSLWNDGDGASCLPALDPIGKRIQLDARARRAFGAASPRRRALLS